MVGYSYKRRPYIDRKEQIMWNNTDKSYKRSLEGKEDRADEYIYIYIKFKENNNIWWQESGLFSSLGRGKCPKKGTTGKLSRCRWYSISFFRYRFHKCVYWVIIYQVLLHVLFDTLLYLYLISIKIYLR